MKTFAPLSRAGRLPSRFPTWPRPHRGWRALARVAAVVCGLALPAVAAGQCTTIMVTVGNDLDDGACTVGHCSLREAITAANAVPDCTRITFGTLATLGFAIRPTAPLPAITTEVVIDGTTHPNYRSFASIDARIPVWIEGSTNNVVGPGLRFVNAKRSVVRGISINGFRTGAGIEIVATTNDDQQILLEGNALGTPVGSPQTPGNQKGLLIMARGVVVSGAETVTPDPGADDGFPGFLPRPGFVQTDRAKANYIAGNTGPGVHVTTSPGGIVGRADLRGNMFGYNGGLEIDLGPEGSTPDDAGDGDAGPNDLLNTATLVDVRYEGFDPLEPVDCTPASPAFNCRAVLKFASATGLEVQVPPWFNSNLDLGPAGFSRGPLGVHDSAGVVEIAVPDVINDEVLALLLSSAPLPPQLLPAMLPIGAIAHRAGPGGRISSEFDYAFTGDSAPVYTRHFAEGVTLTGFETTFSLSNPKATDATATLTFRTSLGTSLTHTVTLPAGGRQVSVRAGDIPGLSNREFGTTVTADQLVAVSRVVTWNGGIGSHASGGVAVPGTQWFLAEGASGPVLDTFYLLYNPTDMAAQVTMTYYRPAGAPIARTHVVPAYTRYTIRLGDEDPLLAHAEASADVRVTNGVGLVVERATYLTTASTWEAGTCSAAAATPTTNWYFGEGVTLHQPGLVFDTFLLLFNPSPAGTNAEITYLRANGAPVTRQLHLPGQSRTTVWPNVEPEMDNAEFGIIVTSNAPIFAERAVWWGGGGSWIEGHTSFGLTTPAATWQVTGGETNLATGTETYVLITNPGIGAATARVRVLFEDGTAPVAVDIPVPAASRRNAALGMLVPAADGRRYAVSVESVGAGTLPLTVEGSTYISHGGVFWRAGHNEPAVVVQ